MTYDERIAAEVRAIADTNPNGCDFPEVPPPSEERIREVEERLGVKFPPSYRAFLKHFGAGCILWCEVQGICDHPKWQAWQVEIANQKGGYIDDGLLMFTSDGGDFFYCFDLSRSDAEGEYPVVIIGPLGDEFGKVVASSFIDFLRRCSRGEDLI